MRYCSNCGALNETDAKFCSNCGKPLTQIAGNTEETANNNYQQIYNYTQEAPKSENTVSEPAPVKGKVFGILSFVFGIVSTVLSFIALFPLVGQVFGFLYLAMAIVGLVFSGKSDYRLAKPGKILCIVGIVLSGLFLILGFIILCGGILEYLDYYYYF